MRCQIKPNSVRRRFLLRYQIEPNSVRTGFLTLRLTKSTPPQQLQRSGLCERIQEHRILVESGCATFEQFDQENSLSSRISPREHHMSDIAYRPKSRPKVARKAALLLNPSIDVEQRASVHFEAAVKFARCREQPVVLIVSTHSSYYIKCRISKETLISHGSRESRRPLSRLSPRTCDQFSSRTLRGPLQNIFVGGPSKKEIIRCSIENLAKVAPQHLVPYFTKR